jgi:hypothetical protein
MARIANATSKRKAHEDRIAVDPIGEKIAAGREAGLSDPEIVVSLYRLLRIDGLLRELIDIPG